MLMTNNNSSNTGSLPSFAGILELARMQRLPLTDLFSLAESRSAAGLRAEAAEIYKVWIAFNEANPLLHLVYFNYSVTLRQLGDIAGSIHALRACLKLDPRFGQAHINLGRAFEDSGLATHAIQQWRSFVEMTSESTADRVMHRLMALQHIGRVMENAGLLDEAETALRQAIELRPDKTEAGQHWSALRQRQCKWPILVPSDHAPMRALIDSMSPLALGCYSDDPLFQLARAYRYNKSFVGRPDTSGFSRKVVKHKSGTGQRLRVGYVSSDLRDHAVGFALREVLELHDKSSVEIYAYYCGDPVANDATQTRMKNAADCWRDIATLSDEEAARQIATDDVDILIDVNGYTKHARTKIFAYRPAPVIVNFCGYPGSMGSPFHQYMIADERIVPPGNEIYYSEKVLTIPCSQPLDRKRVIAERPSRAEAGLPEEAFVFACFNGMQKITEATFAQWMAILNATPGSVLWLLTGSEPVDQRLRQLAEKAGVAPERLIFAEKTPNAKHLARIALADLFLDTFPYGAHSTAADALTMGLPVLTYPGKSFAARFCHSIVAAAGVPELLCDGPEHYVERAIGFAKAPESLKTIRDSLQAGRETSVLRDIPALTRRLEEVFWQMQAESERGETPVPDLRNLDLYYEIGTELVQSNIVFVDDQIYRQRYLEKLAAWDDYASIPHDNRLWTEAVASKK
ncbi:glycosyl transferase [Ciceribacter naphthalenivorans]|uniref:protein O-GlcNAc transferase n=3 Tax=Pseudomonadota TaxID=1224 RepID=A0A512HE77_9HYPH|nr:glycosyl transferase [Ciceribacter naphthalenivorans]GEO83763.1 glycosyl transferase [Ciceribacter naphthalenivorans]GLR24085.1 glycosyl transferase [Ciceribacter naphthalenivorans]GLT06941.1 glycosyl transferase [Sphingomonas psychrolutea]